ncbi:hypothetical protein ACTVLL_05460 [Serratia nevei]|uniref:hypothetical protein n=1 Tax=Serratia nevei TaxID=2703794 RepID=UPI003FA6D8BB
MFHLDNTSGVPDMPVPKEPMSNSPRWFGESVNQGGISWPGADWFNIVQAELLAILERADVQPDKTKFNQIATAIHSLANELGDSLSKYDGLKEVGRCPSIDALRDIRPRAVGQRIDVESYRELWRLSPTGKPEGGGFFTAKIKEATDIPDLGWKIEVPGSEYIWVKDIQNNTMALEEFGAYGDASNSDLNAFNSAINSGFFITGSAKKVYLLDDTWRISNAGTAKVFDGQGCTVRISHAKPLMLPADTNDLAIKKLRITNVNFIGICDVNSIYSESAINIGVCVDEGSYVSNVGVSHFGGDAFVFYSSCTGENLHADQIRDNPIVTRGTGNKVNGVYIGHCAGDAILAKGFKNQISNFVIEKCALPGDNPEPTFRAGAAVAFAEDGDASESNTVTNIRVLQWGGGGAIMNGKGNRVNGLYLGENVLDEKSPYLINGSSPLVYLSGENNSVDQVYAESCIHGVVVHSRAINPNVGYVRMNANKANQTMVLNNGSTGVVVGEVDIAYAANADSIYLASVGAKIGTIRARKWTGPYVADRACAMIRAPMSIDNLILDGSAVGTALVAGVKIEANCEIGYMKVNGHRGAGVLIMGNVTSLPRALDIENVPSATDAPLKILCTGKWKASGWRIKDVTGLYPPRSYTSGSEGLYLGCTGTKPQASSGAKIYFAAVSDAAGINMFD